MHRASAFDLSVISAVCDAMPYLGEGLEPIVGQTPGAERTEASAVDDGPTDGGSAEPDRCAARHPRIRLVHQADSGGAGGPSSRALVLARGRYAFFADADHHRGPEAAAGPCRRGEKFFRDTGNLAGTRASCGV
ncbi:glycosyltransferase [Streptomyces sp. NPDC054838]